jgi:hypothetical protein
VNKDIIEAVRTQLGNAQDNLHRARAAFRYCTAAELQEQHGQSGQTRAQIVDGYADEVKRWQKALTDAGGEP